MHLKLNLKEKASEFVLPKDTQNMYLQCKIYLKETKTESKLGWKGVQAADAKDKMTDSILHCILLAESCRDSIDLPSQGPSQSSSPIVGPE